jgi:hypothetical protein
VNEEPVFRLTAQLDDKVGVVELENRQLPLEGVSVLACGQIAVSAESWSVFMILTASIDSVLTWARWC